jgi:hypothetical protein
MTQEERPEDWINPFDKYPEDGLKLLPRRRGANARGGYGLELQRRTKQTCCAYCGISLVDDYYHWLLLSVDHVIPTGECRRLSIPEDWCESYSNMVICCSGCNAFDNRYQVTWDVETANWTLERFFWLRNKVFQERKSRILDRRALEIRSFESRRWEV